MEASRGASKFVLACLTCILLPLMLYAPSLNAPFLFDDEDNILRNVDIQEPGQLGEKMKRVLAGENLLFERLYLARPVTFYSFALTYMTSGENPYGHRLFNVLAHAAAVLMTFLFTRRFRRLMIPESKDALPLIVALLFAAHPINTDAVTFISNRSDVLATLFYFLGLHFFLMMGDRGVRFGALSLASYCLALGSKEIAATFPLMVLLLDWMFVCEGDWRRLNNRRAYHAAAWLTLVGVIFFRAWYSRGVGYFFPFTFPWTKLNYLYTQFWVIANYLRLLVWPAGQSLDHWIPPIQSLFSMKAIGSFSLLAAASVASLAALRRNPLFKPALFGLLWFFVTLIPTSSFLPINDAMVERRVYLPMWGFLIWAGCLLAAWRPSMRNSTVAGAILIVLLSALTLKRNNLYADPLLLWKEAAAMYPGNYRARFNAGNLLYGRDGNAPEAEKYYLEAVALKDDLFEPHMNLGVMLAREKRFEEAESHLLRAREIRNDHAETAFNLAVLYKDWGKEAEALRFCEEALRFDPAHVRANAALAWFKRRAGK